MKTILLICGLSAAAWAQLPKDASVALQARVDKIAESYSKLEGGKHWKYRVATTRKGVVPKANAQEMVEIYCATIDNGIPTYADGVVQNFIVYRVSGLLWEAEDAVKEAFLKFGCPNFAAPGKK